jgi:carboxymethylenebutenolidase
MALDQTIIDLYDEYTHKPLARRVFLERLTLLAGSAGAASAALAVLEPNYAHAQQVPEADPRIRTRRIATKVNGVDQVGYMAVPAAGGKVPAVIVIHENRGLNAHIEDVVRRFAVAGFAAYGPDMLAPLGGTPADPDAARELFAKLPGEKVVEQAAAAIAMLKADPATNGRVGAVGFCWGGGMVNVIAARLPELGAGVVFYGVSPPAEAAAKIRAPMMMHYAGLDARINAGIAGYEAALKAANVPYTLFMYEGVNHAFHNDTSTERYDAKSATLAFDRTVAFFRQSLGGASPS